MRLNLKTQKVQAAYKETGNKFGADAKVGNFAIEAGYMDDNQENDSLFWKH